MDAIDRKLLNIIQTDFPLSEKPFFQIAQVINVGVGEIFQRITSLKEAGIVRMIGPVIDSRSLGFHSTLVAMKLSDAKLENAERIIAAHPGVSHGYERENLFNVWFTLALAPDRHVEMELNELSQATDAEMSISLPAVKLYKIGAYFDMDEDGKTSSSIPPRSRSNGLIELSSIDRSIINELQQDLPLINEPFDAMAQAVGLETGQFLARCRELQERGAIRRFSASINHRKAGFNANAMACWPVPSEKIDSIGEKLASLKEVSHCYERETNEYWKYNLFAMVHGHSREQCYEIVENMSRETDLQDYILLFSTREFKKTRVKYLV
jgi:DNA-binding Lrp family transcriptional regulator